MKLKRWLLNRWTVSACMVALTGCNGTSSIVVDPADLISVTVTDTQGQPLGKKTISFQKLKYNLNTPATTPPTPYTTVGDFQEASGLQTTSTDGKSGFFMPRHGALNTGDVFVVQNDWGRMYALALSQNVAVDMVTTVFYEFIAYSTVPTTAFTVLQLKELQDEAYRAIDSALANHWIDPTAEMSKLHRAYQNALAANSVFVTRLLQTAILINPNYNLFNYLPFQKFNNTPLIASSSPTQNTPFATESINLAMSSSGYDKDDDTLFYSWVLTTDLPTVTTLSSGVLLQSEFGGNLSSIYNYASDYSTVQWFEGSKPVYVTAVVGDGGSPANRSWLVTVTNKQRTPVFDTQAVTTATEDTQWTYTPAATSPDGAPIRMTLTVPSPVGSDMCIASGYYMANPPINKLALATPPTWSWQNAATPCAVPNQIIWTPNNCQSGPVLSPQSLSVSAVDETGTGAVQSISINVADINTAPTITSAAPNLSIVGETPWNYNPTITDPESAASAIISGAHGCADTFTYSLTTSPSGTTINSATGAITWTPTGLQTSNNPFVMEVKDAHGGVTTESWTVLVNDINVAPTITAACNPTAHVAGPNLSILPMYFTYACSISVQQWTAGSRFTLNVTGEPATMNQFPSAAGSVLQDPNPVNATSMSIQWTPQDSDTAVLPTVNSWPINIQVCNDGKGGAFAPLCSNYAYTLSAPKEDVAPTVTSTPTITVMGGCTAPDCAVNGANSYSYTATVQDGNDTPADTFSYSLVQPAPAGSSAMTVTPIDSTAPTGSAQVDWPVNNGSDLGLHSATFRVTSGLVANGGPQVVDQNFSIFVQETNYIPYFDVIPAQVGQDGSLYTYNFKPACHTSATTSPNKDLTFALAPGYPSGMSIGTNTGIVTWTPSSAQAQGAQPLSYTVKCMSKFGTPYAETSVAVPVTLTDVNQAPSWIALPAQVVGVNQAYTLSLQANDPDGDPITVSAMGVPAGATFTPGANGAATLDWSPLLGDIGAYTITFRADDTLLQTDMPLSFQVVNEPVVLSHPVTRATATYPYHYAIHAMDPAGGGLTFAIDPSSPSGVSIDPIPGYTTAALVSWNPSIMMGGNQEFKINITDQNGALTQHSWQVIVQSGPETPPTITTFTPTGTPISVTEGTQTSYVITANDADANPLHYSFYWDGVWVYDGSNTYAQAPVLTDSGDHTLSIAINDGASADVTQTYNVHVRDALPALGETFTFPSALTSVIANSKNSQLYALQGGGSPALKILNGANLAAGATSSIALPFSPQRVTLRNNFAAAADYVLYFAQLGNMLAGGNSFAIIDSTGAMSTCTSGTCFSPVYLSGHDFSGGTRSVYVSSTTTAYAINTSNRRYVSYYNAGVKTGDVDLGVGASANDLVYDSVSNKVFVSAGGTNQIVVINPASNTVAATIAGTGTNPSALAIDPAAGKLYIYSPASGSLTEVAAAAGTVNFVINGLPTSAVIGADPRNVMLINSDDHLLYLTIPDAQKLVIYDAMTSTPRTLNLSGTLDEVAYDSITHRAYGAFFSLGRVIRFR